MVACAQCRLHLPDDAEHAGQLQEEGAVSFIPEQNKADGKAEGK